MPVNTPHAQYSANFAKWVRCRDAHGGSDDIKAKGTVYLPALEGMGDAHGITYAGDPVDPHTGALAIASAAKKLTSYEAYKQRAMFYPATGRTIMGLVGMLFGKPPTPPDVSDLFQKHF